MHKLKLKKEEEERKKIHNLNQLIFIFNEILIIFVHKFIFNDLKTCAHT